MNGDSEADGRAMSDPDGWGYDGSLVLLAIALLCILGLIVTALWFA